MACTKFRLSSSLFFSDSRLLFNKALISTAEKLDFVWAFVYWVEHHGKKTDILDLFWQFPNKVISECFNWWVGMYAC